VRDLLIATLPFETTLGERTIQRLVDGAGPVPFVRDADTYAALADVAAHAGVLVVNAGGLHEAELLSVVDEPGQFREVSAADVVELARPVPHPDVPAAAALSAKARAAIAQEGLTVDVGSFEPADRPVLWWPTAPGQARMVLNAANSAVKRLLGAPPRTDLGPALRALYVAGLLAGRATPTPAQVATLGTAVLDMVEDLLADGG